MTLPIKYYAWLSSIEDDVRVRDLTEDEIAGLVAATRPAPDMAAVVEARSALAIGDRVEKIKGSCWTGRVVGFYRTELTPYGVCVESEREPGSVQIYPEAALRLMWSDETDTRAALQSLRGQQ